MEEIVVTKANLNTSAIEFKIEYNLLRKQEPSAQYYFDTLTINNVKFIEVNQALVKINDFVVVDTSYQLLINRLNGILLLRNDNKNEEYRIIKMF